MADFRKDRISRPIRRWAKRTLPQLSETEAEALGAGDVWWEAELFSGNPDWRILHSTTAPELSVEEQAFISGPCHELCALIDDWELNQRDSDLSPEVWQLMRQRRFFGMIIDRQYGGLGFTAFAHSEVVRFIATRSVAAAVTVMVPNSLGPGELLHQFGTDAQKDHWLPRLADGRELPAFGLTSADAGSDASAMRDEGVVEMGTWHGQHVLGIRLNWAKRYITLAPVCTVLGLAFKLRDPDHLLGDVEEIGITCALVPTDLPGVETGQRHIPSPTMFMNGPTLVAVARLEPVRTTLRKTGHDPDSALEAGVISQAERDQLATMDALVARVIAVDDFTPEQLRRLYPGASHEDVATQEEAATRAEQSI